MIAEIAEAHSNSTAACGVPSPVPSLADPAHLGRPAPDLFERLRADGATGDRHRDARHDVAVRVHVAGVVPGAARDVIEVSAGSRRSPRSCVGPIRSLAGAMSPSFFAVIIGSKPASAPRRSARARISRRWPAFCSGTLVPSGCRGSRTLVWAPLGAERPLPDDVGLDPVAVADVDGRRAGEPVDGALEGLDAPGRHVVEMDVERRLVELEDVQARGDPVARLLVEAPGELDRESRAIGRERRRRPGASR